MKQQTKSTSASKLSESFIKPIPESRHFQPPLSETVRNLTNEYYEEGQKIKLRVKQMIADLTIVASASLDNADLILTLNRKTMSSDLARNVYSLVNSRRKLKIPQFLTDKLSIRRFPNVV